MRPGKPVEAAEDQLTSCFFLPSQRPKDDDERRLPEVQRRLHQTAVGTQIPGQTRVPERREAVALQRR